MKLSVLTALRKQTMNWRPSAVI